MKNAFSGGARGGKTPRRVSATVDQLQHERFEKGNQKQIPWHQRRQKKNKYVLRTATSRARGETQKCNEGNADPWIELGTELRLKARRRLDFVWVKGHATKVHIDRQITTNL